jgi:hypothetical protein
MTAKSTNVDRLTGEMAKMKIGPIQKEPTVKVAKPILVRPGARVAGKADKPVVVAPTVSMGQASPGKHQASPGKTQASPGKTQVSPGKPYATPAKKVPVIPAPGVRAGVMMTPAKAKGATLHSLDTDVTDATSDDLHVLVPPAGRNMMETPVAATGRGRMKTPIGTSSGAGTPAGTPSIKDLISPRALAHRPVSTPMAKEDVYLTPANLPKIQLPNIHFPIKPRKMFPDEEVVEDTKASGFGASHLDSDETDEDIKAIKTAMRDGKRSSKNGVTLNKLKQICRRHNIPIKGHFLKADVLNLLVQYFSLGDD